jgi:2-polyprenyl-3-methyl-5-hydroxy-6-metoxy-1,4-benzoquinol methylase
MSISTRDQAEIERSALEAAELEVLAPSDPQNVARYLNPPADTVFPLEYSFFLLGDVSGKRVLDFGCGTGEDAIMLAARGASVIGIDISPELIELARKRAAVNGVLAEFVVGSAYETGLPDQSVDVVFIHAILHHLDLEQSKREVMRVLRPGGIVTVQEPVRDSRVLSFLRKLIPYHAQHVSEFEAPLTKQQLDTFCDGMQLLCVRRFRLPLVAIAKMFSGHLGPVYRFDGWLLKSFPWLSRYATVEVRKLSR